MTDKFAFIDTPIFLHYRPFDEMDWLSILKAETASIVIAPITISELNEKKDEGKSKQRQRAALALKRLESLSSAENPLRPGVDLLIQDVEPFIDYAAHQLEQSCQDDRLLAAILHFRGTNPSAKVILVSPDFGLRIKAKRLGIEVLCLDDDLKLPDELDPGEKRVHELEQELLELKRIMPEPELTFVGGSDRLEVVLEPPITLTAEDIRQENKLTRLKYPKSGESSQGNPGSGRLADMVDQLSRPSKESVEKYNVELDRFYLEHDAWVASKTSDLNRERRTVRVELMLGNKGTAPANVEAARSFNFHYALVAANLPKPTEGDLHVIVKKSTASSSQVTVNSEAKQ